MDIQKFHNMFSDKYFDGKNLVYIDSKANINMDSYKLLMMNQSKAYGEKAVEEEIISTAKIESIDYSRDSVRNILKGYAPKDDAENRIFGMKKGFDFIADKNNKITEENIYKLYMMAVGDFLDDENKLLAGNKYRHDSVHIQDLAGEVAHTGINHNDLPNAMANLVEFICNYSFLYRIFAPVFRRKRSYGSSCSPLVFGAAGL